MSSRRPFAGAVLLCAQISLSAFAEGTTHYDEPGITPGRDYVSQHFAERIDPFTGNLSLQQTDLSIPGNAGFDVAIRRSYNANSIALVASPFGRGWDIHFGRVLHRADQTCAGADAQSLQLELADGSRQTLHRSSGVASTSSSDYLTTSFWKAQCDASGMIVFSPDGTKYEMTEPDGAYWHAKRITDRFGNSMTLSYIFVGSIQRKVISQVLATEGRQIVFSYASDVLTGISGAGVMWRYTVAKVADGSNQLQRVAPPAGNPWEYSYNSYMEPTAGSYLLRQVVNPFRGTVNYTYQYVNPSHAYWLEAGCGRIAKDRRRRHLELCLFAWVPIEHLRHDNNYPTGQRRTDSIQTLRLLRGWDGRRVESWAAVSEDNRKLANRNSIVDSSEDFRGVDRAPRLQQVG